ncbi:class I SAM-dependent methyltransferase [Kribbella sp. NPDC055071]
MTDTVWVDPANADQLTAWDTSEGVFWAENAEPFEDCLERYDDPMLRAAGIRDGDRVLDVGCGTGSTTRAAGWLAGSGTALGVDLSTPMLTVAARRARAAGVGNATFMQADAQVHRFEPGGFDVLISRTGCMFFADPTAAFTNLARAVKPGGRISLIVWQSPAQNPWFTELTSALLAGRTMQWPPPETPGPFAFAETGRVAGILTTAGFAEPEFQTVAEPMYWGPDVATAKRLALGVLGWLIVDRTEALKNLRNVLTAHHSADGVTFDSTAWLVTSRRPG